MNRKQVTNGLQVKRGVLEKLINEKNKMTESLDALNKKRNIATRALAIGDESQREIIFDIEGQIAPILLRLEGIDQLTTDASAAVNKAQTELEQAQAEEYAQISTFITEKYQGKKAALIASLPQREREIISLHQQLCIALAELQIDMYCFTLDGNIDQVEHMQDLLMDIPVKIRGKIEENGLRPLFGRGSMMDIVLWPLTNALPGGRGPVNPVDVARIRHGQYVQELTAEFNAKNNQ